MPVLLKGVLIAQTSGRGSQRFLHGNGGSIYPPGNAAPVEIQQLAAILDNYQLNEFIVRTNRGICNSASSAKRRLDHLLRTIAVNTRLVSVVLSMLLITLSPLALSAGKGRPQLSEAAKQCFEACKKYGDATQYEDCMNVCIKKHPPAGATPAVKKPK